MEKVKYDKCGNKITPIPWISKKAQKKRAVFLDRAYNELDREYYEILKNLI